MRTVRDSLIAARHQDRVLVEQMTDDGSSPTRLTYRQMRAWSDQIRCSLAAQGHAPGTTIGLVAGNSPSWLAADLALLTGQFVEVPVPLAFSAEQAQSLLCGVRVCLVDDAGARKLREWMLTDATTIIQIPHKGHDEIIEPEELSPEPSEDRIIKVIHTSGTTGVPKGVKIRRNALDTLVESLNSVTPAGTYDRYLSLVPFSLLIEQVTAVYLPMRNGGRVVLLPESTALLGTARSRASDVLTWLRLGRPSATVLPPAMVSALTKAVQDNGADLDAVLGRARPFLMAGGAPVNEEELRRLDTAGLRIYEGYGLSENSSVVAWNGPSDWRPGTVGKPLAHCTVKLSDRGELLVKSSSLFAGYTVEDPTSRPVDADGWLHTGDRAEIDKDGYIRILGRLKNMIITGHARNVFPEWVESRLRICSAVVDAVVLGEGMEYLTAVLIVINGSDPEQVCDQVRHFADQNLAETDRPERFVVVADSESFRDKYFTVTGRPKRDRIFTDIVSVSHST